MSISNDEIYKSIANKLVGKWYNFMNDEVFIFSLADNITQQGSVEITNAGTTYNTSFTLTFQSNRELKIHISKLFSSFVAILKVLADDTLIFQEQNGCAIIIYERRVDTEFSTQIIKSLSL